ncbi:hypothetical protein [Paraburkholderia sp. A3RO-2L]|jgi:hypothetical protein|uniref:hypothetical protein n=1 Tax=unclassified Paraburkholderia TaxID=2615204 RepID=UPI003DA939B0
MLTKILNLFTQADFIQTADKAVIAISPVTGEPDNQVVSLNWGGEDGKQFWTALTEQGLEKATFNPATQSFTVEDYEGDTLELQLLSNGSILTPDDAIHYVLIQEGGTSTELYIHAHATRDDAEADREECETNGAYRTSEIIEVPASLATHPAFYEIAEQLVRAVSTIDFPSSTAV